MTLPLSLDSASSVPDTAALLLGVSGMTVPAPDSAGFSSGEARRRPRPRRRTRHRCRLRPRRRSRPVVVLREGLVVGVAISGVSSTSVEGEMMLLPPLDPATFGEGVMMQPPLDSSTSVEGEMMLLPLLDPATSGEGEGVVPPSDGANGPDDRRRPRPRRRRARPVVVLCEGLIVGVAISGVWGG